MKALLQCLIVLLCCQPSIATAQQSPDVPASASEGPGFVPEPDFLTRLAIFTDRHFGKGDLTNGIYWDYGNFVPSAGWGAVGPGYRHWYGRDTLLVDASMSVSTSAFKVGQARVELPSLVNSRLLLGVSARRQDFGRVDFFGSGPSSQFDSHTLYGIASTHLTGYAIVRPARWLDISGQFESMDARTRQGDPRLIGQLSSSPASTPSDTRRFDVTSATITADGRDFPGHPTKGALIRVTGSRYDDRTDGRHTFEQMESEFAGFVPLAGSRAVLGLHGWLVDSRTEAGHSVPFYLQPTLGGVHSLRSYMDRRFQDDSMAVARAELRFALTTHLDFALLADAGGVGARARDLHLDKQSFGAGFRLHTRRETFVTVDAAHGDEGWRVLFRMYDPLLLPRLARRTTLAFGL